MFPPSAEGLGTPERACEASCLAAGAGEHLVLPMAFGVRRQCEPTQPFASVTSDGPLKCMFPHPTDGDAGLCAPPECGVRWENQDKALGKPLAHSTLSMVLLSVQVLLSATSRHLALRDP